MKFEPVKEDEYKARNVWPKGWYAFSIGDAPDSVEETFSKKSGLPMFKVTVQIFNDKGIYKLVTDYLITGEKAWKLRMAAEAFGLLDKYKSGELCADDIKGKSGFVKIDIDDKDPQYEPKNVIREYRKELPNGVTQQTTESYIQPSFDDKLSDEVPF